MVSRSTQGKFNALHMQYYETQPMQTVDRIPDNRTGNLETDVLFNSTGVLNELRYRKDLQAKRKEKYQSSLLLAVPAQS